MTSATIPGLDSVPTKHAELLAWVREVAELTGPDRVVFADGSERSLFVITAIADRFKVADSESVTTFFRGIDMSFVDSASAASLNTALKVNVFSASVSVARGVLEVSRVIPKAEITD